MLFDNSFLHEGHIALSGSSLFLGLASELLLVAGVESTEELSLFEEVSKVKLTGIKFLRL